MVVLGGCAVWALVTAAATGGRPEGVLLAVLAVVAGYAGGRILGALLPVAAPAAGALAGAVLMVAAPHTASHPDGPSWLGTTAGEAAIWTLCAGGACCAAGAAAWPVTRLLLRLLAAVLTVAAALFDSPAGAVGALVVLVCSLAAARVRRSPGLAGLAAVSVLAAAIWVLAADALPPGWPVRTGDALGAHRVLLWRDAAALALDHPLLGAGPGRCGDLSPTVAAPLPTDGRPHSALLQQAAEQGLVGVVLLVACPAWAWHTLWRSTRPTSVVLTAAAALTVLAGLALVGNALSFTSVTAGAGLLAGVATAQPMGSELPGHGD